MTRPIEAIESRFLQDSLAPSALKVHLGAEISFTHSLAAAMKHVPDPEELDLRTSEVLLNMLISRPEKLWGTPEAILEPLLGRGEHGELGDRSHGRASW